MATPCPTWRPPWWLWVKPWATSSGVWGLRTIIQSFFSKVSVKCKSYPDVMSRCGQTPHSWHSWVKTRISKIFKFVYFHHFEWALHRMMISWSLFSPQGGPRHHQQLPRHKDEVGDAQVAHRHRDGRRSSGRGKLEFEVRSILQGENMINLTFIFAT